MSSTFERILVTSDLSEASDRAVSVALELAAGRSSRIYVLHVIEDGSPNPLYAHYYPTPTPEQRSSSEREARKKLTSQLPPGSKGVEVLVAHGDPATEICREAEERRATLIVIASHGRSGFKRLLLGSVAERIVRHAVTSVMVVRGETG